MDTHFVSGNDAPCPDGEMTIKGKAVCWRCEVNRVRRGHYLGHRFWTPAPCDGWSYARYTIVKKPDEAQAASGARTGCSDEGFLKKYPTIVQYMTDTKWDDGTPREISKLSITLSELGVNLALNDQDLRQSVYTTAGSLTEALGLMEKALRDGTAQWRPWKAGKKK